MDRAREPTARTASRRPHLQVPTLAAVALLLLPALALAGTVPSLGHPFQGEASPVASGASMVSGWAPHASEGVAAAAAPPPTLSTAPEWLNLTAGSPAAPSSRMGAMEAYDPLDGYTVLFGGLSGSSHFYNDTWTYTSGIWKNISSSLTTAPTPRFSGSLIYDPAGPYLLLFGGCSGTGCTNDTWTFSGGAWHLVPLLKGGAPSGRGGAAVAFVASVGYPVLFGGERGTHDLSDTWAWRGTHWSNLTSTLVAPTPLGRTHAAFGNDPALGEGVLFGGVSGSYHFGDTWAFKSANWTNLTTTLAVAPSPRGASVMAFDAAEGYLVLYGGCGATGCLADTWNFTASGWTHVFTNFAPGPLFAPSMAYDGRDGYALLFGGRKGTTDLGWTWVLSPPIRIALPHAVPKTLDAGMTLRLFSNATGGNGTYTWTWHGLPSGCASVNASQVACITSTAGTANITVTVNATNRLTGTSHWVLAQVNPALAVTSSASVHVGLAPLVVAFQSSPTGGTPPSTGFWHFGDGNVGVTWNTTHVYALPGSYNATIWANDTIGQSASSTITVLVLTPLSATVVLSANVTPPHTGVLVQAHVTGGEGPYTFAWTLNGSAVPGGSGASLPYTPEGAGNYTFAVTVTDTLGDVTRATVMLLVQPATSALSSGPSGASGVLEGIVNNPLGLIIGLALGLLVGIGVAALLFRKKTPQEPAGGAPPEPATAAPVQEHVAPGPPPPEEPAPPAPSPEPSWDAPQGPAPPMVPEAPPPPPTIPSGNEWGAQLS